MFRIALTLVFLLPGVSGSDWDDFTNNLATDLAPLLSLFGEQATKQFLSESTDILDNIIFAMAPLGILTAVVSVIRVCGGASLRAFVGRAQEGHGDAEAELCSSTSHDVCELWNRGGIARVFGNPEILEFVQHENGDSDFLRKSVEHDPTAGLYRPKEYFDGGLAKGQWEEERPSDVIPGPPPHFAPRPNLSLNIGIRKISRFWFFLVAILGCLLQTSVLVFGVWATYVSRLLKNGEPIQPWAFPLASTGTLMLCSGMLLCSWLIERSTLERVFKRISDNGSETKPRMFWLQPGNQLVGDQNFDAFAHSACLDNYITSWKYEGFPEAVAAGRYGNLVWIAVMVTMIGFILQFVGLRGLHSSVAMFQLGVTMVMAGIRAGLRTQRLGERQNRLRDVTNSVKGHELDWQAFRLLTTGNEPQNIEKWEIVDDRSPPGSSKYHCETGLNSATKIMEIRARLARLTNGPAPAYWETSVRLTALNLQRAIEKTAKIFFTDRLPLNEKGQKISTLDWTVNCQVTTSPGRGIIYPISLPVRLQNEAVWQIDPSQLEAVLGLWCWSLKNCPDSSAKISRVTSRKYFAVVPPSEVENLELNLKMWGLLSSDQVKKERLEENPGIGHETNPKIRDTVDTNRTYTILSVPTAVALHDNHIPKAFENVSVLSNSSGLSILEMCAHDLFTSFVDSSADMMFQLTDIAPVRRHTYEDRVGGRGGSSSHNIVQFANPVVNSAVRAFTDEDLGSQDDALMSIIPSLLVRSKLPLPDKSVLSLVVCQKKSKKIDEAQDYLRWGYYSIRNTPALHSEMESVVRALGELYRRAMRAENDFRVRRIGYEGIVWMLRTIRSSDKHINEIKENYGWVGYQIAEMEKMAHRKEMLRMLQDAGADPEIVPNFKETRLKDALETDKIYPVGLLIMEKWRAEITAQAPEQMPLPWAAHKGCIELVEDLLDVEADLNSEDPTSSCTPLTSAARNGHTEVVNLLIDKGAAIRADGVGWTPLLWAAKNGHESVTELLLGKSDVNPDFKDAQYRRTPLSWAAEWGHQSVVERLLKAKVELNTKDNVGRTPLSWAAWKGRHKVVELLLKRKSIDVNSADVEHGQTALSWAASMGHKEVVRLLITHDPTTSGIKDHGGRTPLSRAAAGGHTAVIDILLLHSTHSTTLADSKDNLGRTPLSWAAEAGHEDVLKLLINQKNVDPDSKDNKGRTPLSWAAWGGHVEAVESLVKWHDVEADSMDNEGWTPLLWAAVGKRGAVVQLLMSREDVRTTANNPYDWRLLSWPVWEGQETAVKLLLTQDGYAVDSKDDKGFISLWWATVNRHEAAAKLLREKNWIGPNTKDSDTGQTLLWWAAYSGNAEVVELLLERGGTKSSGNSTEPGQTPLWWAAGNGHDSLVKIFIEKGGVDLNANDFRTGQTLLSHAAALGKTSVVELLVDRKDVDLNSRDLRSGRTPLSWAAGNGHAGVTKLLLRKDNIGLNSTDWIFEQTPLSWAAENGHVEVVDLLLGRNDIDIECRDSEFGKTAVRWAEDNAHEVVVSKLLAKIR